MRRRWDTDERGHGVASASAEAEELDRLRAAMLEPDWVAEEPEHHLLPHVERSCAEHGWTLRHGHVEDAILDVRVVVAGGSYPDLRHAAFALIGSFAEASTHIVERRPADGEIEVRVTTGMLDGDGSFAPHGHVVRLRISAA